MKRKWTRRKFLVTGLKGSVVVGGGIRGSPAQTPLRRPRPRWPGLDAHGRDVLRAAIDELIPSSDSMPSASNIGAVDYLERLAHELPGFQADLESVLAKLEQVSGKLYGHGFRAVSQPQRVEVLGELEARAAPRLFSSLLGAVYEAYYTRPEVWKQIGYEFYPTNEPGPHMKSFDEEMLAQVRKRPRLYREVP